MTKRAGAFLKVTLVVLLCTTIVGLSGCATRSKPSLQGKAFTPFTVKGLHFKVSMPGEPVDQSTTNMMSGGKSNRYVCEDSEIAFGVSEDTIPMLAGANLSNPLTMQKGLDGACSGAVKGVKGTEAKRTSVVLGGGRFPGREIEGTVTEPMKGKFRYRIYLDPTRARLYTVGVVGFPGRVDAPEVESFLSSVTLF
jgi:hypothetical protein